MHLRTLVLFSIGLNFVLGIGWGIHYFQNRVYSRNPILRNAAAGAERITEPNNQPAETKPKRFHWRQVESNDYETYIQNLRSVGCPQETIRDIIVADVNKQFESQRGEEALTNDVHWWKTDSGEAKAAQYEKELVAQESERRQLLSKLLGPDWSAASDSGDLAGASNIYLGGPVLGELSSSAKEAVHKIAAEARKRMEAYAANQRFRGQVSNPIEEAQLRGEMRAELAQVLTPAQLEEFLLRYSETAEQLRRDLRGVQVSADEFRMLFRIRDPIQNELVLLGSASGAAPGGRGALLQAQLDNAVEQTLGFDRYQRYRANRVPAAKETQAHAEKLGLNPEATATIVAIAQEFSQEQQRIRQDATLSESQRIDALAALEAEQQRTVLELLGAEGFQEWERLQASR